MAAGDDAEKLYQIYSTFLELKHQEFAEFGRTQWREGEGFADCVCGGEAGRVGKRKHCVCWGIGQDGHARAAV